MKTTFCLLAFFIIYSAHSQQFAINVIPRYGLGITIPANYAVMQGKGFLDSRIKTVYSGSLIDVNGNESQYNQNSDGIGLDVMFKYTNEQNGNAWGLLIGAFKNKYVQYVLLPEFGYKGHTLTGHYSFYRATGLSAGLRRVFMNNNFAGWYVQMNALYSLSFKSYLGTDQQWGSIGTGATRYVENGTGVVITQSNVQPSSLVLSPEVGFVTRGNFGFEVSLAYQVPLGSVYQKQITYYESNRIYGQEEANITQNSLWINLKVPINVFKRSRTPKQRTYNEPPHKKYEPKPLPEPAPAPKKYQDLCVTVFDQQTKQIINNAKILVDSRTYYTNREGKFQILAVKIDKKIAMRAVAEKYENKEIVVQTTAQDGCQLLSIELSPIPAPVVPPPTVVEINGKSVRKGESMVLNALQFEQGKSGLSPEAKAELDLVADYMRKYPTLKITLSGHTSNEGDYYENVGLSKDRVAECKRYLVGQVQNGSDRIKTNGYGPSRPLMPNTTPENRAKNRRVELTVESL